MKTFISLGVICWLDSHHTPKLSLHLTKVTNIVFGLASGGVNAVVRLVKSSNM